MTYILHHGAASDGVDDELIKSECDQWYDDDDQAITGIGVAKEPLTPNF